MFLSSKFCLAIFQAGFALLIAVETENNEGFVDSLFVTFSCSIFELPLSWTPELGSRP